MAGRHPQPHHHRDVQRRRQRTLALTSCLTAGIANISATRGVPLTEVQSTIEGDIDLRAIFGLTDEVRNGYQRQRVHVAIALR